MAVRDSCAAPAAFLRASGDLLHCPAQLLGGGGRLRHTGREFLGRGREPFGGLSRWRGNARATVPRWVLAAGGCDVTSAAVASTGTACDTSRVLFTSAMDGHPRSTVYLPDAVQGMVRK